MSKAALPVDLRPDHWHIVQDIIRQHVPERGVVAFGSRATWTAKEYSDLDLAILGDEPLPIRTIAALIEDLSESDLPFKVDIVDWASTDERFRKTILRHGVHVLAPMGCSDSEYEDDENIRMVDRGNIVVDSAIEITPSQKQTLVSLLEHHLPNTEAWAYRSRLERTARPHSDLDLVVFTTPAQQHAVSDLREAFKESNLPFRVDLCVWDNISASLQQLIQEDHMVLIPLGISKIKPAGGVSVDKTVPEKTPCEGVGVQGPLVHSGTVVGPIEGSVDLKWRYIPFTEAVVINPKVRLERGMTYSFVDMAAVIAGSRCVHAVNKRTYFGSGSRFQGGDTLMARITPCLENGKIARYCTDQVSESAHGSTEFIVIRGRSDVTDFEYVYYLTQWDRVRSYAIDQMTGTSGRQRVPVNSLDHLLVPVPPLPEQRTIANILGLLDDKIELNRRMNRTLEAMARAIFKDWFVDFGPVRAKMAGRVPYLATEIWELFPDTLDEEDKPAGWVGRSLGKLFDVSIGRTPPRKEHQHFVPRGAGRTWLSIKGMKDIQTFALASDEDLTTDAIEKFKVPIVPAGTVMVSFKLTVGRVAIASKDMYSNEAIAHLVENHGTPVCQYFTYCFMKDFDYDSLSSTSSIATAVNSNSIKAIELIVPDAGIHSAFAAIVQPIFDRILLNLSENITLMAIRDLLLPKLMSGEIRLPDIERVVKAVA